MSDDDKWPRLVGVRRTRVSPWVTVVEKSVEMAAGAAPEVYHCLAQAPYVTLLAVTDDGRIPIVQQYRAAVEEQPWELPAGMLEADEDPVEGGRRELLEETGLTARRITNLGTYFPDTGRLENRLWALFIEAGEPVADFCPEPGMRLDFVTWPQLKDKIRDGTFRHQLHIAMFALVDIWGLPFPRDSR